ncbi:AAA family ATPase [Corynebacterium lizhenjunii]|uniref:AAA family ATPase n=1 Tax=Corynebacterium lizhenjunii TaxID=2709394 RepID=A0A7T0PBZ0_9CORY|nr:ATP-binding protein [Corynebacterium lizhenjunii]QPK79152.1 AAA family ATPase [Corynebacterium lizhenjunii]
MLLELKVKNFRSFKEETTLSLVATREQKHQARLPYLQKRYRKRINPLAGVYGPNAAGKSNLVAALQHLKSLVLSSSIERKTLPFTPFKLSKHTLTEPCEFSLLFSLEDAIYEYSIAHTRTTITFEALVELRSRDELVVFERTGQMVEVDKSFEGSSIAEIAKGVRPHVPVVSGISVLDRGSNDHVALFSAPSRWLENVVIIPAGFTTNGLAAPNVEGMDSFLHSLGVGIEGVERHPIPIESIRLPEEELEHAISNLGEDELASFETAHGRYEVTKSSGQTLASRVLLTHHGENNEPVPFDWSEESDGTKASLKLFPLFWALTQENSELLLIIDELDRSFHTLLVRQLIEDFLHHCSEHTRSQLIFTTHDLMLMDLDIFRRDEIWIAEKSRQGATSLISLSEYKGLRADKDLRRSYLDGRFGGLPLITTADLFSSHRR